MDLYFRILVASVIWPALNNTTFTLWKIISRGRWSNRFEFISIVSRGRRISKHWLKSVNCSSVQWFTWPSDTNLFTSRSVIFLIKVQFVQHKLFAYDSIITHLRVVNRSQISPSNQCLVLHVFGFKTILMLQVLNRFTC